MKAVVRSEVWIRQLQKALALTILVLLFVGPLSPSVQAQCVFSETQKITAPGAAPAEFFGEVVSVSGGSALIGAYGNNHAGSTSGIAHTFVFDGTTWGHQQALTASDSQPADRYGFSVSLSGNVAAVGAPLEDTGGDDAGAVYIYRYDGSVWIEEQKLIAPDGARGDLFGRSLSVDGDIIVIGAHLDDDLNTSSGGAYVFRYDETTWNFDQKLLASDGEPGDFFGISVAISGETIVIGSSNDTRELNATGAAYVFRSEDGGPWSETQKLVASDANTNDRLGSAVAIDRDVIALAAGGRCCAPRMEAVYVFRFELGGYVQAQILEASDGLDGDLFGTSVSVSNGTIAVGAKNRTNGGISVAGACYLYTDNGVFFEETQKLTASDPEDNDFFGVSVSVDLSSLWVGSSFDDDGGTASGSAYIFSQISGARLGTVNASTGNVRNVLFLNGSAGSGNDRIVEYPVLDSFTLEMRSPPAVPSGQSAPYAVYVWPMEPSLGSGRALPLNIGCTALPMPLTGGSPQPSVIWNNAGRFSRLGFPRFPSFPAPDIFFRKLNGLPIVGTFYIQGVIFDPASSALVPASVTNGILGRPVFQ